MSQMLLDSLSLFDRIVKLAESYVTYLPQEERRDGKLELLRRIHVMLTSYLINEGVLTEVDELAEEGSSEQSEEEDPSQL